MCDVKENRQARLPYNRWALVSAANLVLLPFFVWGMYAACFLELASGGQLLLRGLCGAVHGAAFLCAVAGYATWRRFRNGGRWLTNTALFVSGGLCILWLYALANRTAFLATILADCWLLSLPAGLVLLVWGGKVGTATQMALSLPTVFGVFCLIVFVAGMPVTYAFA